MNKWLVAIALASLVVTAQATQTQPLAEQLEKQRDLLARITDRDLVKAEHAVGAAEQALSEARAARAAAREALDKAKQQFAKANELLSSAEDPAHYQAAQERATANLTQRKQAYQGTTGKVRVRETQLSRAESRLREVNESWRKADAALNRLRRQQLDQRIAELQARLNAPRTVTVTGSAACENLLVPDCMNKAWLAAEREAARAGKATYIAELSAMVRSRDGRHETRQVIERRSRVTVEKAEEISKGFDDNFTSFSYRIRAVVRGSANREDLCLMIGGCELDAVLPLPSATVTTYTVSTGGSIGAGHRPATELLPEMRYIPSGTFDMGDLNGGGGDDDEQNVQKDVPIGAFRMAATETTAAQFAPYLNSLPGKADPERDGIDPSCSFEWRGGRYVPPEGKADHPVRCISFEGVNRYLVWLNRQPGGGKYRLPNEAEWEYAARAGTKHKYWWGNHAPVCDKDKDKDNGANFKKCNEYGPVAVKTYAPNPRGLYEVHGNLWEWTCSLYQPSYADEARRCAPDTETGRRVLRSGSFAVRPGGLRAANRGSGNPGGRYYSYGFRLAQDL